MIAEWIDFKWYKLVITSQKMIILHFKMIMTPEWSVAYGNYTVLIWTPDTNSFVCLVSATFDNPVIQEK